MVSHAARLLRWAGVGIYRTRALRRSLEDACGQLRRVQVNPSTVFDVGVAYGTWELYRSFPRARFVLVEPLREYSATLDAIAKAFHADGIRAAAGAKVGTVTLNVHEDLSGSSLFSEAEGSHVDGRPREVPMTTLDAEAARLACVGPYVLKLDVQGAELAVLEGARSLLPHCEAVILETSLLPTLNGAPLLGDVVATLRDAGFVVYDIVGSFYRPLDGALTQVDLVFVPENAIHRKGGVYGSEEERRRATERLKSLN